MLTGEIKAGDKLQFAQPGKPAAQISVVSILEIFGEKIFIVSIDGEMPVQITEDFLRERCRRDGK